MKPDPKEIPGRMFDRVVLCMSRLSNMLLVKDALGGRGGLLIRLFIVLSTFLQSWYLLAYHVIHDLYGQFLGFGSTIS